MDQNINFICHYKNLDNKSNHVDDCYNFYSHECKAAASEKILRKATGDMDGYYGTYLEKNELLTFPVFYSNACCLESERFIITRYRTGSHNLKIQTGRLSNLTRELRLCTCLSDIQALKHVLCVCPLTEEIRQIFNSANKSVTEIMNNTEYNQLLQSIENKLKLWGHWHDEFWGMRPGECGEEDGVEMNVMLFNYVD